MKANINIFIFIHVLIGLRRGLNLVGFRLSHTPTGLIPLLVGRRLVYGLNGFPHILSGIVHLPRRLVYILISIIHHG
ncbi:hypothetical protein MSTHC_0609 [Methanosarcina thermophila CHTI-55]|uniref:Uncharacterized protein n=2 Tax=Methanosarcina thermophila TaxID=2210 RepID=A0A0E3NH61_METTE|nr:hypothetical protein MSTHT_0119 [Methanosarcina thermophila TM-1]AKB14927.1 hypothetical protein MSTHC_0609 [Methanosarcina thermophila CHTI-55]